MAAAFASSIMVNEEVVVRLCEEHDGPGSLYVADQSIKQELWSL